MGILGVLLAAGAGAAEPGTAPVQAPGADDVRGEVHASLGGYGWWGVGGRVEVPVVPDGVVNGDVKDALAFSGGGDLYFGDINTDRTYYAGGAYGILVAMGQWNFYIGDWSLFPEFGVALYVGDPHYMPHRAVVYPALSAGAGVRYTFADGTTSVVLRLSSPTGLQAGVVF